MRLPLTLWIRKARAGSTSSASSACAVCRGVARVALVSESGTFCSFCGFAQFEHAAPQSDLRHRLIAAHLNRSDRLLKRFERLSKFRARENILIVADTPLIRPQAIRDVTMGFGMTPDFVDPGALPDHSVAQIYCLFAMEISSDVEAFATDLTEMLKPGGVILIETFVVSRRTVRKAPQLGIQALPTMQNISHLMERKGCQLVHKERSRVHPIASLLYHKAAY